MNLFAEHKWGKVAKLLALLFAATAIALRLWVYFQGRDLIIDEANIARNIYERSFAGLLKPLDYEQYAPPVYLWVTKLCSVVFGFAEWSLKLYPILCGIAAVFVLYKILQKLVPSDTIWYPLGLFAFTAIIVRYSSELKQYSPDVFITLLLIWLALKIDVKQYKPLKFFAIWSVIGTLAILSCMPSVFVLAGIGCYYGWDALSRKEFKTLSVVAAISIVWVGVFGAYYLLVLQEQANSEYLQNFHHYYFLFATPSSQAEWNHNQYVFDALMYQFEGVGNYAHMINRFLLLAGFITLFIKNKPRLFLLLIPLLSLFAAAATDKFSLMPRVSLFILPVLMIVIGVGFARLFAVKSNVVKFVAIVCGVYAISYNVIRYSEETFKYEEVTEGLQFFKDKGFTDDYIGLYHSTAPAYKYYSEIHPNKEQWQHMNIEALPWYINYDSLAFQMQHVWKDDKMKGFLYTNTTKEQFEERHAGVNRRLKVVDSINKPYIKAYIYD